MQSRQALILLLTDRQHLKIAQYQNRWISEQPNIFTRKFSKFG